MKAVRLHALLAALVVCVFSPRAAAQAWLADRARTEGMGIRAGNLELHPGIGAEFGYDSNYFQRAGDDAAAGIAQPGTGGGMLVATTAENERIVPMLRLRVTPHLSVSTLGPARSAVDSGQAAPPDLKFRGDTSVSYSEFFPIDGDGEQVRNQRNLQGRIGGTLDIKPYSPVGADLEAEFVRAVEPSNAFDTANAFDRSTITGGGGVSWRPGGGLFRWRLGYRARATIFQDEGFEGLGNLQHTFSSSGRWLFLPRTALLSQSEIGLIRYGSSNVSENSGDHVRSMLGINGLFTYHFGFLVLAGWGATFYESTIVEPENYDGAVGQVEMSWYPRPQPDLPASGADTGMSAVAVGYTRDFQNSYFGDYYQRDRVYARLGYLFGGVVVTTASFGYSLVTRPTVHFPDSDPRNGGSLAGYSENRLDGLLFVEYRITDSLGASLTFRYDANLTHQQAPNATTAEQGIDDLGYSRYQIYAGFRWFL